MGMARQEEDEIIALELAEADLINTNAEKVSRMYHKLFPEFPMPGLYKFRGWVRSYSIEAIARAFQVSYATSDVYMQMKAQGQEIKDQHGKPQKWDLENLVSYISGCLKKTGGKYER